MCPFSQIYGQARFRDHGVAGLWRDKARPSRIPLLSPEVAEPVVALTLAEPPPGSEPLDRIGHGQSGGDQRQFGAADLARSRPEASFTALGPLPAGFVISVGEAGGIA
jgi:hypothetical protein